MKPGLKYTGISTLNESFANGSPAVIIRMNNRLTLPDGQISDGVSCTELFADIRDGRFVIVEGDYDGQPKRGTRYYAGTARNRRGRDRKQHPVVSYGFKWEPRKFQVSIWSVDNPRIHVQTTLTRRTGRALTKLLEDKLTGAQG